MAGSNRQLLCLIAGVLLPVQGAWYWGRRDRRDLRPDHPKAGSEKLPLHLKLPALLFLQFLFVYRWGFRARGYCRRAEGAEVDR